MVKRFFHGFVLLAFLMGLLAVTPAVPAAAGASSQGISPQGMLNPDGTLNLGANFSGSLDLSGWDVQIDPARGPVFTQSGKNANVANLTPALGNWEALGGGINGKFNYEVNAVVSDGSNVYVGGNFINLFSNDAMDYIAKWDGSSWSALSNNGSGNGALGNTVTCLALDGGGNLYAGGYFSVYNTSGNYVTGYIAKWNGSSWSALGSDGSGGPSLTNAPKAILISGTNVYVGGYFSNVNNNGVVLTAADYIAKWDGSNWSALSSDGLGNGSIPANKYVFALAMIGSDLYVGGSFTNIKNGITTLTAADYIAKWDGSNWSAVGSNGASDGSLTGTVYALASYGTNLYVGGAFANVNNVGSVLNNADYAAKWDGSNWSALGSGSGGNGSLNGNVLALTVDGSGNVFAGGYFYNVNNSGIGVTGAVYIAKFDGSNWSALGSDGAGNGALKNSPYAIAIAGSNVYVGGVFTNVNNSGTILNSPYFARWDGSNWNAMTGPADGVSNRDIYAILVDGTDVYVGGDFQNLDNNDALDYIAKWDGSTWSALGDDGNGNGVIPTTVYALAMDGSGNLYVGGSFYAVTQNNIYDATAAYLARWDGSNWSGLGSDGGGGPSITSYVYAIAISGNRIYVGGYFNDVNNNGTVLTEADAVAMWDGSDWYALGSDGSGGGSLTVTYAYSYVYALALDANGILYVGGYFYDISNNGTSLPAADFIATWDGSNWGALSSNGSGDGSLNGAVNALALDAGGNLYVGGDFNIVNNGGTVITEASSLAKWDGSNWSAIGSDGSGGPSINNTVSAIAIDSAGNVYVGGYFSNVNNNGTVLGAADCLVMWDGTNWNALGSNGSGDGSLNKLNYPFVKALALSQTVLYAGGKFLDVNNNGVVLPYADNIAAYGVDYTPPTVVSITRVNPDPTALSSVDFTVTFSENVDGVDDNDFTLPQSGVSGASITNVTGANDTYTVTVDTGIGNGTLGLNLADDDTIYDQANLKLGGAGLGNGNFTGETYTVSKTAPAQIVPANGATLNNRRPFFDWSDFAGAKGYQIQVSKGAGFGTTLLNVSLTGATNSQYTSTKDLPANTLLYWRVRAKLSATKYSVWSSAFTFTTGNPPSVPSLVSPANGALVTNLSPTLDWSDSTVPAGTTFDHYQVQLDDNSDFSSPYLNDNTGISTYNVLILSPNTKYFWRVRAFGTNGHYSGWSVVRNFRVAIDAPLLLSPIGGVTVGSLKPLFDWNDISGATGYTIQVSLSSNFGTLAINVSINTPTSQYVHSMNLQTGKLYYWRVRANGPNGPSLWSATETFQTP